MPQSLPLLLCRDARDSDAENNGVARQDRRKMPPQMSLPLDFVGSRSGPIRGEKSALREKPIAGEQRALWKRSGDGRNYHALWQASPYDPSCAQLHFAAFSQ